MELKHETSYGQRTHIYLQGIALECETQTLEPARRVEENDLRNMQFNKKHVLTHKTAFSRAKWSD